MYILYNESKVNFFKTKKRKWLDTHHHFIITFSMIAEVATDGNAMDLRREMVVYQEG